MSARFNIKSADSSVVDTLQRTLGLPRFFATVLAVRGIDTPQKAREFMEPSLDRDWGNPYDIPGLEEVVDRLESAIRQNKRVLVFGDFDLDGISAVTVLTRGLRMLDADAVPFVPRRSDEGYGISEAAIERLMGTQPDVLVSVDCGISNAVETEVLKKRGVEVLITDHHEPGDAVPQGVPVCDPKLEDDNPFSILAGVGVALKIVQALGARFGQPHLWRELTDIASLGTIADLVPLVADNRALVADGTQRMSDAPRPCVAALLASAGVTERPVAANSLSFSVIPRLNAAGRMGDARLALDLLLCDDFDEASKLAARLETVNDQRRAIEAELAEIATLQAKEVYREGQRALVVAGAGWHEGVKGIVASRLVRNYGVPCLLFTIDEEGEARGSGRSVGDVNLFKAVESCADILTRFGGHEAAVGVTLPADRIPEFTERLLAYMDTLPDDSFRPRYDIDACVNLGELTLENVQKLSYLAPYGQDNRPPRFLAQNVLLTNCRAVGAEKNHFSCTLTDGSDSVAGIMFHCADISELMQCGSVVNAAFEVQIDEWRGRQTVKAMLGSLTPASMCAGLEACLDPECKMFMSNLFENDARDADVRDAADNEDYLPNEEIVEQNRITWTQQAHDDPDHLLDNLVATMLPEGSLFPAQKHALDALMEGKSVLAVMATGRGKSLIFQIYAALRALRDGKASVFVYPLRALIADQAYHVRRALAPFGLSAEVLTGESTPEERKRVYTGLADGSVDIVLTTPEFLQFHAHEMAAGNRIAFVAVDESHHIGLAKAGTRPAYAKLGETLQRFASDDQELQILALTATAQPSVARDISTTLGIDVQVLDPAERTNLTFDDQRNTTSRDQYLANLVASGEKAVIYVNSREASVSLARTLRTQVPHIAPMIGFYNAGLSRTSRKRVEDLFRSDSLQVLVATSAFGEGVNIPNIRHVVLYHMPFNDTEFNQMSGRAGRDGQPATIHVLFGKDDAAINESLLVDATPDHDTMAQVYRELRTLQQSQPDADGFTIASAALAQKASQQVPVHPVSPASADCAVAVFRELGLIEARTPEADVRTRCIRVLDTTSKVELTDSVRYREGLDEQEAFRSFRDWVLKSSAYDLHNRIMRPILPNTDDEGGCSTS